MEFTELIRARRSVRAFKAIPIETEKLNRILELANLAPSAGNLQAYEIYHVTAAHTRAALARAADQSFIAEAPVILAFFANPGRSARKYGARGKELYAIQDATIAATRITVRSSTSTTAPPPADRIKLTADTTPFPISFTAWTAALPSFLEALPPLCADS